MQILTLSAWFMVGLVAVLHLYFLALEMFFWDRPLGLRVFGHSRESAASTRVLAANQGLYNGFLAAGLIWGLLLGESGVRILIFFLLFIIVAGLYGAYSANRKILFFQAMPAAIALLLVLLSA